MTKADAARLAQALEGLNPAQLAHVIAFAMSKIYYAPPKGPCAPKPAPPTRPYRKRKPLVNND